MTALQQRALEWTQKLEEVAKGKPEAYKWRNVRVFSLRKGDRVNVDGVVYIVHEVEQSRGSVGLSLRLKGKAYRIVLDSTTLVDKDLLGV
jgi:hypothetical protein